MNNDALKTELDEIQTQKNQKIALLETDAVNASTTNEALKKQILLLETNLGTTNETNASLAKNGKALKNELDESTRQKDQEIMQLRKELMRASTENEELKQRVVLLDTNAKTIQVTNDRLAKDVANETQKYLTLKDTFETLETAVKTTETQTLKEQHDRETRQEKRVEKHAQEKQQHARKTMVRILKRIQRRGVVHTFHAWLEWTNKTVRMKRLLERAAMKTIRRRLLMCLNGWHTRVKQQKQSKVKAQRCVVRMRQKTQRTALQTWFLKVKENKRLERLLTLVAA
jgi:hypothetical protein